MRCPLADDKPQVFKNQPWGLSKNADLWDMNGLLLNKTIFWSRIMDDWVLKAAQGWCLIRIVLDFSCETIRAVEGQSFLSLASIAVGLLAIDEKDLGQHG